MREAVPAEDGAPVAHEHPRQWWRPEVCLPGLQRIVHLAVGVGGPRSHPREVTTIRLWPVREAVCGAALLSAAHEASHCTSHEAEAPGSGFWDTDRYWWVVASSSSESCSFSSSVHFSSRWNLCAWQRPYVLYLVSQISLTIPMFIWFLNAQDGICALGKGHICVLHPVSGFPKHSDFHMIDECPFSSLQGRSLNSSSVYNFDGCPFSQPSKEDSLSSSSVYNFDGFELFFCLWLSFPGDWWCDVLGFVLADVFWSASLLHLIQNASHFRLVIVAFPNSRSADLFPLTPVYPEQSVNRSL